MQGRYEKEELSTYYESIQNFWALYSVSEPASESV